MEKDKKNEQPIKKSEFSVEELLAAIVIKNSPDGKQIHNIRRVQEGEEVRIHVIDMIPNSMMGPAIGAYAEYAGNPPECLTLEDKVNVFGKHGTFRLISPCVVWERSPTATDSAVVCASDDEINIASRIIALRQEAKEILEKFPLEALEKAVSQLKTYRL